jgi:hypothetical protein
MPDEVGVVPARQPNGRFQQGFRAAPVVQERGSSCRALLAGLHRVKQWCSIGAFLALLIDPAQLGRADGAKKLPQSD